MAERPIIIKRKKGGHAAHHGGAWKVAYADFVTAMMAFFLVMWIMGLSESTRRAIAGYFREPGVFSFTTGKALPDRVEVIANNEAGEGIGPLREPDRKRLFFLQDETPGCAAEGQGPGKVEAERMAKLEADVKRELIKLATTRPDLAELLSSITVEITNEGLRIEMSELDDLPFFDVGTAVPKKTAREVLAALAPKLATLANPIDIEGHTDTRTFPRGASYTNWELSADRANAARKILLENGVAPQQLARVTGYADRKLRKPEAPYDVTNRRVSIVVKYLDPDPAAPAAAKTSAGTPGLAPELAPALPAAPTALAEPVAPSLAPAETPGTAPTEVSRAIPRAR